MKTLLIGYGNAVRGDDGAGAHIVREIEKTKLPGVSVRIVHQLQVELIEDFSGFDRIIFVDARNEGPEVSLEKIQFPKTCVITSSHHAGPELLGNLAKKIYGFESELFLCSIRGENFDFKKELSPDALTRAKAAITQIRELILKEACHA